MTQPPPPSITPSPTQGSSADPSSAFPRRSLRIAISLLILWHLAAVIGRPWEFATQGPFGNSPSASTFYQVVDGYSQFMYLDHGYAFFAPDPGPSHYFVADVHAANSSETELKYPDLSQQWPRLLYHRHFMLAEFLNNVFHPVDEPPSEMSGDAIARTGWLRERQRYLDVKQSIIDHLAQSYPDAEIEIQRGEHRQPGLPEFIGQQMDIRDPSLMIGLPDRDEPPLVPASPLMPQVPLLIPNSAAPISNSRGPEPIANPAGEPVQ